MYLSLYPLFSLQRNTNDENTFLIFALTATPQARAAEAQVGKRKLTEHEAHTIVSDGRRAVESVQYENVRLGKARKWKVGLSKKAQAQARTKSDQQRVLLVVRARPPANQKCTELSEYTPFESQFSPNAGTPLDDIDTDRRLTSPRALAQGALCEERDGRVVRT
ncbi:hypothetical protein K435DRAFT_796715 [Dendrothele bispora CBS 962.96]|uniref:Uncharacterized protein n=1 Tax=Dendrothele bispora (strain CBS 962.96) TaxID=1314807 RepID=A0A4S8M5E6_DENBC|nr:hypothetical protein K435DRAFT_796715 [Dendrothele bispora CBS 962.96]